MTFSAPQVAGGWLITVPVALFEEAAFRGLVFLGLARSWGPRRAALVSSAFFMVWHYGAQGLSGWPAIFVFGLAACGALHAGAGLPLLAAAHELVDGAWYLFGSNSELPFARPWLAHAGFLLMAAAAVWGWMLMGKPGLDEAEKSC